MPSPVLGCATPHLSDLGLIGDTVVPVARSSSTAARTTTQHPARSGTTDRSGRRPPRCPFPPKAFVIEGRFGRSAYTTTTGNTWPDAAFSLPVTWPISRIGAREFEWLMTAIAQHVFFVRVRTAIAARNHRISWLANRLCEVKFPGGERPVNATIYKVSRGTRWLDPRDRAVIESLVGTLLMPAAKQPVARASLAGAPPPTTAAARSPIREAATHTADIPPGRRQQRNDDPPDPSRTTPKGERTGAAKVDVTTLPLVVENYPGLDQLLLDAPRVRVRFEADQTVRRPLPEEARKVAVASARKAVNAMRDAATELYVAFDLLHPHERVARASLSIEKTTASRAEPYGMAEGCIATDDAWANLRLPADWWETVGQPGWSLLDRRFVFSVLALEDGRPVLVRALALVFDPWVDTPEARARLSDAWFLDAELDTYRFRVIWSRSGRARLVPDPDPDLDREMILAL